MSEEVMIEENKDKKTPNENFITLRNFRKSPEVENFYRFVNENDLRREAHLMLGVIVSKITQKKKKKSRKVQ